MLARIRILKNDIYLETFLPPLQYIYIYMNIVLSKPKVLVTFFEMCSIYEAGYRETSLRGGSTSPVAQFLHQMGGSRSEQRNRQEIT